MIQKFSDEIIQKVWEKGTVVIGINPNLRRKEACGAWIDRSMYGDRSDKYNNGWEIDHINPESQDGTNNLSNLRPLQWYNNTTKSDGSLSCPVKAR